MGSRVAFTVSFVGLSQIGIAVFLTLRLREAYRMAETAGTAAVSAEAVSLANSAMAGAAIASVSVFLLAMVMGDFLIARKTRKLARAMMRVIWKEADPSAIPRGMGELDGITDLYGQCIAEIDRTKAAAASAVRDNVSEMELNRGLTELQMARLEALLASMGEAVVATDREGRVSFLNGLARQALWWRDDQVRDVPIFSAFQLEDEKGRILPADEWPIAETLREGRTAVTPAPVKPLYLRKKDNAAFPVKITFSPVTVGNEVAGALAVFSDITAEVEIDRRKTEFISIASHQLRSPSSAIRMMTDMMRKGNLGELTDRQQDWVEKMFMASDNLTDLINGLLNVSRLEAGAKMTSEIQDSNAVLDDITKKSGVLLIGKGQELDYSRPELPPLTFDRFMIEEVVKNLLTNASKYSPAGSTIKIRAEIREGEVAVLITDRGIGIPQADRQQMFGKFFRAHNAARSETKGTGLGLYYCKTAVEKHGGRIGFDSEEGKGSTFWFTLPLNPQTA
ncbi:hypothetical protein JW899_01040 [Candidatus Uhrbacteria bacterium]|nr:hypothetical protein [Candidatus Uhrbacteria bacterium]